MRHAHGLTVCHSNTACLQPRVDSWMVSSARSSDAGAVSNIQGLVDILLSGTPASGNPDGQRHSNQRSPGSPERLTSTPRRPWRSSSHPACGGWPAPCGRGRACYAPWPWVPWRAAQRWRVSRPARWASMDRCRLVLLATHSAPTRRLLDACFWLTQNSYLETSYPPPKRILSLVVMCSSTVGTGGQGLLYPPLSIARDIIVV